MAGTTSHGTRAPSITFAASASGICGTGSEMPLAPSAFRASLASLVGARNFRPFRSSSRLIGLLVCSTPAIMRPQADRLHLPELVAQPRLVKLLHRARIGERALVGDEGQLEHLDARKPPRRHAGQGPDDVGGSARRPDRKAATRCRRAASRDTGRSGCGRWNPSPRFSPRASESVYAHRRPEKGNDAASGPRPAAARA